MEKYHKFFTGLIFFATIYALFAADFAIWIDAPKSWDVWVEAGSFFVLVIFTVELVVSSIVRPGYFLGLFFFLDLVAAISLIPDVTWLRNALFGLLGIEAATVSSLTIARAGRAARAGTRAARILRIARIVRLARVAKLFSVFSKKSGADAKIPDASINLHPSKVGQLFAQRTTIKTILGVILIIFIFPFLNSYEQDVSDLYGLETLENVRGEQFTEEVEHYKRYYPNLVYLKVHDMVLINEEAEYENLRESHLTKIITEEGSEAWFNIKASKQGEALRNMLSMIFIITLLAVGSFFFSRDAEELFIGPIERMIGIVQGLSRNPLMALDHNVRSDNETALIRSALARISSLLQIAFGEAGAEIIAENLSSDGEFNPMVQGKKVSAIFGFTDIRQFTNATEILEEGVVDLVNKIGGKLHQRVVDSHGFANKNIGDAFLLVWKDGKFADDALDSFLNTIEDINESEELAQIARKVQAKIPEYGLKMGFGLHFGWAIEGAIGSKYKVDPTYISPHVNMSSRLEAATKQFKTTILMSEQFYTLLSQEYKEKCRRIDRVTFKGSAQPMSIYTIDLNRPASCNAQEYRRLYESAVNAYIAGNWADARTRLEQCRQMWKDDGPLSVLWGIMEQYEWQTPVDWEGYRKLTEK